jgi:hypothetical protein
MRIFPDAVELKENGKNYYETEIREQQSGKERKPRE